MATERRFLAGAALVLLVAACDAPTYPAAEPAYDATGLTRGIVYRWRSGQVIRIYPDTTSAPAGFDMVSTVAKSTALWNDATRFADYRLAVADRPSDADVIVRFRFAPLLVDLSGCEPGGSGAGRTAFCTDTSPARVLPLLAGGGGRVKMDVYVDPEGRTAEQLAPFGLTPQTYFQALVTHELGHVLGIGGHSPDAGDVMFEQFIRVTAPSERDIRTLRWVWRQPVDLQL